MFCSSLKCRKILIIAAMMVFGGTIAEPLFFSSEEAFVSGLYAARRNKKSKASKKKDKTEETKQKTADKAEESDYLSDAEEATEYVPDIYRCADCGYEQDEPGVCPDHTTVELVKIADKARNPLAPVELDGNEDIIVDIPLKNVVFRKEQLQKESSEKDKEAKENKKQ